MKTEREIDRWKKNNLRYDVKGNGTVEDPFVFTKVEQLREINAILDFMDEYTYFDLGCDIDFEDPDSYVNCDNMNKIFYPIGMFSTTEKFSGFFDGKGYCLKNFKILNPLVSVKNNCGSGLFADLDNAFIIDVNVNNITVCGYNNIGSICGNMNNSTITHCDVNNFEFLDAGNSRKKSYGGLVGLSIKNNRIFNNNVNRDEYDSKGNISVEPVCNNVTGFRNKVYDNVVTDVDENKKYIKK